VKSSAASVAFCWAFSQKRISQLAANVWFLFPVHELSSAVPGPRGRARWVGRCHHEDAPALSLIAQPAERAWIQSCRLLRAPQLELGGLQGPFPPKPSYGCVWSAGLASSAGWPVWWSFASHPGQGTEKHSCQLTAGISIQFWGVCERSSWGAGRSGHRSPPSLLLEDSPISLVLRLLPICDVPAVLFPLLEASRWLGSPSLFSAHPWTAQQTYGRGNNPLAGPAEKNSDR